MDDQNQKLIEEQFKSLPPQLQRAIEHIPWKSTIKEIALSNSIPLDKVADVEQETMFAIYGFEDPVSLIDNLVTQTGLDESKATAIAEAVNERIFKRIAQAAEQFVRELKISDIKPVASPIDKKEIVKELSQRVEVARQGGAPTAPQVIAKNLPMVEKGETVHDVPHVETPKPLTPQAPMTPAAPQASQPKPLIPKPQMEPDFKYTQGKDPYREPLE